MWIYSLFAVLLHNYANAPIVCTSLIQMSQNKYKAEHETIYFCVEKLPLRVFDTKSLVCYHLYVVVAEKLTSTGWHIFLWNSSIERLSIEIFSSRGGGGSSLKVPSPCTIYIKMEQPSAMMEVLNFHSDLFLQKDLPRGYCLHKLLAKFR